MQYFNTTYKTNIQEIKISDTNINDFQKAFEFEENYLKQKSLGIVPQVMFLEFLDDVVTSLNNKGQISVIYGPEGLGKNTNLLYWYSHNLVRNIKHIYYPTISGSRFTDVCFMMQYLSWKLSDFDEGFIFHEHKNKFEIIAQFFDCLMKRSEKEKIVIIIPAIDKFSGMNESERVDWLPMFEIPNVSFILSTSKHETLDLLSEYSVEIYKPKSLRPNDILCFTSKLLSSINKNLSSSLLADVCNSKLCSLAVNLSIILEEIKEIKIHEEIDRWVHYYLDCKSYKELFIKVIQRWEKDYNTPEYPNLVEEVLVNLQITLLGLSEQDLITMGGNGLLVPQNIWISFRGAISPWLIHNNETLIIGNNVLKVAIKDKYLNTPQKYIKAYRNLADYFLTQWMGRDYSKQLLIEYPYALAQSRSFKDFESFYKDPHTLNSSCKMSVDFTVQMLEYYKANEFAYDRQVLSEKWICNDSIFQQIKENHDFVYNVATIRLKMGEVKNAKILFNSIAKYGQHVNDIELNIKGVFGLALIAFEEGDYKLAKNYYEGLIKKNYKIKDFNDNGNVFYKLGVMYYNLHEYRDSMHCFKHSFNHFKNNRNYDSALLSLRQWSYSLKRGGELELALNKLNEAIQFCDNYGYKHKKAIIQEELGTILYDYNHMEESLEYLNKALSAFAKYNDYQSLAICLSKRALCTIKMEDLLDEAIVDLYNAFEQCRTYGLEHVHTEILMNYSKLISAQKIYWKSMGLERMIALLMEAIYSLRALDGVYLDIVNAMSEPIKKIYLLKKND